MKKEKGKAREAIKAAGRETTYEVARGKPADGMSVCDKRKADHGTSNWKTGFVFPFLSLFLSSMLTLDQSTLFYFSINRTPEPFRKGIKSWASHVELPIPSRPNSKPGSKAGSQHNNDSFLTSKSTLVDHIVITAKVDDCSASPSNNNETFSCFVYKDETVGVECDFAVSSPIKGSGRLTSSVKKYLIIMTLFVNMLTDPTTSRILSVLRIPPNWLNHPCVRLASGQLPIFPRDEMKIACFVNILFQCISNSLLKEAIHGLWII